MKDAARAVVLVIDGGGVGMGFSQHVGMVIVYSCGGRQFASAKSGAAGTGLVDGYQGCLA